MSPACLDVPPLAPDAGFSPELGRCLQLQLDNPNKPGSPCRRSYENISEANRIISKPEGWLIVPATTATELEFKATTFGSSTSCEVVTGRYDVVQPMMTEPFYEEFVEVPFGDAAYDCKRDRAGLDLTGNFSTLGYDLYRPTADSNYAFDNNYAFVTYTDSSMSTLETNGMGQLRRPTYWYALPFRVQLEFVINETLLDYNIVKTHTGTSGNTTIEPIFGLVRRDSTDGSLVNGILSCTTTLSDVVCPSLLSHSI